MQSGGPLTLWAGTDRSLTGISKDTVNRANFITPSNTTSLGYSAGSLGDTLSGAGFGDVLAANDPRIAQLALKISF